MVEDLTIIDGSMRGQTHAAMSRLLKKRSAAAVEQRLTRLASLDRAFIVLPEMWKKSLKVQEAFGEAFVEEPYSLAEDQELMEWRVVRGCRGLRSEVFDDSHSKESLRRRLSMLEVVARSLSGSDVRTWTDSLLELC